MEDIFYRVSWCNNFDYQGSHSALFGFKDVATKYFNKIRAEYPNAAIITETIDEMGNVLKRKLFNKPDIDEFARTNQQLVHLVKYDIEWKRTGEDYIFHEYTFDEANKIILNHVGTDGYGTKWIYLVIPCSITKYIYGYEELPASILMKVNND